MNLATLRLFSTPSPRPPRPAPARLTVWLDDLRIRRFFGWISEAEARAAFDRLGAIRRLASR